MVYKFDLTADDYIETSLASNRRRAVLRAGELYALLAALAVWILVREVEGGSLLFATAFAAALFVGTLAYFAVTLRKNFASAVTQHYESRRSILGPHTLELTDLGLESSGPLHRSLALDITRSHFTLSHLLSNFVRRRLRASAASSRRLVTCGRRTEGAQRCDCRHSGRRADVMRSGKIFHLRPKII